MSELHDTLRDALAELAHLDPSLRRFGARHHRYQPGPPLSPARVAELEAAAGVALPDDYREHLLHVGDGGAGPYLGLMPLDHPIQRALLADRGAPTADDPWHGVVGLAHLGCNHVAFLVVDGPARGQVWLDARGIDAGVFATHPSFLAWYLTWIDSLARGQWPDPLVPPGRCAVPVALTKYLHRLEQQRGVAPGGLDRAAVAEAMADVAEGSLRTLAIGSSPFFDHQDPVDICLRCEHLLEQLGVARSAAAPGLPPRPCRP